MRRAKAENRYGYDDMSDRKTFFIDSYCVPFRYRGKKCMPGKSYLINDTDSTLVLYPVYFYNGLYSDKNISRHEAIAVRAHSFNHWDKGIDNRFNAPCEHSYVQEKQKGKMVVQWTIDTEAGAAEGRKKIGDVIAERNGLMNRLMGNR